MKKTRAKTGPKQTKQNAMREPIPTIENLHEAWHKIGKKAEDNQENQKAREDYTDLVRRRPELRLSDGHELTLERQTCDHFHDIVSRFFEIMFNAVGWRFRQTGPIIVEG